MDRFLEERDWTLLARLRAAFPRYEIDCDRRRDPPRYSAKARDLSVSPWCVITDSVDELRRELGGGRRRR